MEPYQSTTPFGRRPLSLAHVANQLVARARQPEKAVHKWTVFRDICTAKEHLGATERSLAVLDALLSFHPETVLTGDGLVVFPSNMQLAQRAHGMAPATLRRHLAVLVDTGLVVRRDSPNGKRYARKGRGGEIDLVFGFDLSPLVARAEEFAAAAEAVRAAEQALKRIKERITLCRRDIVKMIEAGIEAGIALPQGAPGPGDWAGLHAIYRTIVGRLPRTAGREVLGPIAEELTLLAGEIANLLETHTETENTSANESQFERHKQNSKTESHSDSEPRLREALGAGAETGISTSRSPVHAYPLGLVMEACPDLADYARDGIANWRDFLATAAKARSMLGISPSAWEEAETAMGEIPAAIIVACILQKASAITSAGGYLRSLTKKAEAGEFSIGPMLMALIGPRKRDRLRA